MEPTMLDDLYEQVFARPDDDAPRVVLADHLIELGDPRGEFIALQIAEPNGPTGLAKGRARQLKRHYEAWLPPGVQRSSAVFRRGFLHACRWLAPTDPLHRAWKTVEQLECASLPAMSDFPRASLLGGDALPRLKELSGADPDVFDTLCEGTLRERLETLRTSFLAFDQLASRLGSLAQFPRLRTLDLEGTELPGDGLGLILRPAGSALRRLLVEDLHSGVVLRGVLDAVRAVPGLTVSIFTDRNRLSWFEFSGAGLRLCHRRAASAYMRSHLVERAQREGLPASVVAVVD